MVHPKKIAYCGPALSLLFMIGSIFCVKVDASMIPTIILLMLAAFFFLLNWEFQNWYHKRYYRWHKSQNKITPKNQNLEYSFEIDPFIVFMEICMKKRLVNISDRNAVVDFFVYEFQSIVADYREEKKIVFIGHVINAMKGAIEKCTNNKKK